MPDAPEAPGFTPEAEVPGQLSAASIREVWPEIMTAVSRKSKKIAALAQGATVRDLEGQTVVLTFRFPAHAKMVAAEPTLISDALYEALGGRWQIRCDVAGEGGGSGGSAPRSPRGGPSGPAQRSPQVQEDGLPRRETAAATREATGTTPNGGGAPTRQREAAPRASVAAATGADDEWPEPARPGGLATALATPVAEVAAVDDEEWPETARPGGAAAGGRADETTGPGFADPSVGQTSPAGDDLDGPGGGQGFGGPTNGSVGSGVDGSPAQAGDWSGTPGFDDSSVTSGARDGGLVGVASAAAASNGGESRHAGPERPGQGSDSGAPASTGPRNDAPAAASAQPAAAKAAPAAEKAAPPAARRAPSSGLAAARAAAAGAGRGTNASPASKTAAWPDGSPTEEAPYDPEYDGPPRPADARASGSPDGGRGFEGFDPGDEPLDDVIDEKTARQSSEQQAVQLLRDALGAEKISES
jgi:DNA polymerase-3 subunit gamma/tau